MEPETDLLLIGHAVEDWIFEDDREPRQQFGGIYNVARGFKKNTSEHFKPVNPKISIEPCSYGHAFIKIDRKNATKDVSASLNDRHRQYKQFSSKWTHFSYFNEMHFFNILKKEGILSADLCEGHEPASLNIFDYVFCSIDEFNPTFLSAENRVPIIIAHSPEVVQIWNGGEKLWQSKPIREMKNICILGAGDFFASSFIFGKMYVEYSDSESCEFAIKKTNNFLINKDNVDTTV